MYKIAYRYSDDVVFYFDYSGNKYVANGGNVAWRINNPGLVHHHVTSARKYGSIGTFGPYAIFPHPRNGHEALAAWIHSKKYFHSTLRAIARHYEPDSPDLYIQKLSSLSDIIPTTKIKDLNQEEMDRLLRGIEKLCGYAPLGNETFSLLPKIADKIEHINEEDTYLVDGNIVLSKNEALDWIQSHRLDGVVVHERNGAIHLRSRPNHVIRHIKIQATDRQPSEGNINPLVRTVGTDKPGQCIWAFINGISNTKDEALASTKRISQMASGERVYSMQNDTVFFGVPGVIISGELKLSRQTLVVQEAVKFFRYLLALSESKHVPVVVFVHSQGAIITEHGLEVLSQKERERLIVFTFGGGSFIAPGKAHPDSHNFASSSDPVCLFASPTLRFLALQRYFGSKEGLNEQEVIHQLASADAMLNLDAMDKKTIDEYVNQRTKHYENKFLEIKNLTILDPDPDYWHQFRSSCYQTTIQMIINRYQHQ